VGGPPWGKTRLRVRHTVAALALGAAAGCAVVVPVATCEPLPAHSARPRSLGALAGGVASDSATASAGAVMADAVPQRDVFDVLQERLFHRRIPPEIGGTLPTGISWTMLPSLSYNPVYGFAFGASFSGAGRLGRAPDSKPSSLSIAANYSTTGQLQAQFRGDVYAMQDNYLAKIDIRYLDTSRSTWGIGPLSEDQQEYPMQFKLARWYATLYRRVKGPVYVGLGFHYDDYMDIVDERAVAGESTPFTQYSGGAPTRTRSSGVSLNLLAETRDNLVNPSSGYYLSATFRDYLGALGSDEDWQEYWAETRLYPHFPAHSPNVLAFWIYTWFTFGPGPYLALPSIGWDTYGRGGRGYLQGRIRGQNQIYLETEYRLQLRRDGLLGAVGFLNATVTTNPDTGTFARGDKGGGAGLRVKFNKRSNTNLAIDRAWGEAGSKGWFFGLTEVF